ncbi:hypothetical protein HOY82DRAFT_376243 [Tuber indicum]|nr:hypothetical protein HOY82DRAFT_376243 [Tuber indicum]
MGTPIRIILILSTVMVNHSITKGLPTGLPPCPGYIKQGPLPSNSWGRSMVYTASFPLPLHLNSQKWLQSVTHFEILFLPP